MPLAPATRISTLASTLDDKTGLFPFIASTTLETVASRASLRSKLALVDPAQGWRGYRPLYETAQELRGKPEADAGTVIHGAVQALVEGRAVGVDDATRADAAAVLLALRMANLEPVATEEFGVCTQLPELVAGTRDLVVKRLGVDAWHVVDIKSVASLGDGARYSSVAWAVQLACYALSGTYPHPFERDKWGRPRVDRTLVEPPSFPVSQTVGLVVEVERGTATAQLHAVDLVAGLGYARLACEVRAARRARTIMPTPAQEETV